MTITVQVIHRWDAAQFELIKQWLASSSDRAAEVAVAAELKASQSNLADAVRKTNP